MSYPIHKVENAEEEISDSRVLHMIGATSSMFKPSAVPEGNFNQGEWVLKHVILLPDDMCHPQSIKDDMKNQSTQSRRHELK